MYFIGNINFEAMEQNKFTKEDLTRAMVASILATFYDEEQMVQMLNC